MPIVPARKKPDALLLDPPARRRREQPEVVSGGATMPPNGRQGVSSAPNDDDDVGYRRPPKKNQFQPGMSGNPKGRPKRAKGIKASVLRALDETVTVKTAKGARRMPRAEMIGRKWVEQGQNGSLRALERLLIISEADTFAAAASAQGVHPPGQSDADIVAAFRAGLILGEPASDEPEGDDE